ALLDPYHARLKGELERFGGTVEKFIGDAVMAIFGAPVAHEDDAERAVRAALAIRDWAAEEQVELRVGINSGEALVTLDANAAAGETMASGDVVNTAARLQSAAPIGEIVVGEQTFRATSNTIDFIEAAPVVAKGKAQPLSAWQAVSARARSHVERVHGASLVGRRRELDMLSGALERARQERASQLVTLVGVPGIGKSRLVFELFEQLERNSEPTTWRHGQCLPYGDGITFWALGEMVKAQAGILEDDDEREAAQKLHAAVDDPWIESHLRTLVGLRGGPEGAGDRRDEAFTAWRRFFEGLAEERPLVLVFEDIHWADDNLIDFIDHLVDWATGVPLLAVCTARPELLTRRPGWGGGKPNALTISLSPLSDAETTALLRELLDGSLLMGDAQTELLARAGGNPLYAEEYVRMIRERGRFEQLPETVQGMVAARLDLLDPDEKSLIQDAAVVGRNFWLGALSPAGEQRRLVEDRLHALERKDFVRRERASSVAGDVEYSFRHVLFRDVAYGQIPRAERAQKHRRAAEWIQCLGRPEDHAEMLAHHYLRALELGRSAGIDTAGFADRAASALTDASDRAFRLNAYGTAARYQRAALDQLAAADPRRPRLLLSLGTALWLLGEPDVEVLEGARDGLLVSGDIEGAGDAETRLAEHFYLSGERDVAFAHLWRARELLDPLPPSPVKAHTIVTASLLLMLESEYKDAKRMGEEALRMAEELGLAEVRASALNNIGMARYFGNEDEGGLDDLTEAIRVAGEANSPFELSRAKGNLSSILWGQGRITESLELDREAKEDANRFGQLNLSRWFESGSGLLLYITGDWGGALSAAEAFIAEIEAGRPSAFSASVYCDRARIRLGRGDGGGALADAEKALAFAARASGPEVLLPAITCLAHISNEVGNKERAAGLASEFLSTMQGRRGIDLAIWCIHELAWTLASLGRGEELVEALRGRTSPWARAAVACAEGDAVGAAAIFAGMGVVTQEAFVRLQAGRAFISAGRAEEGDEQLRQARAFYRSVGASRYIEECNNLLAERG
ncbi:MAG: AAA family ATPase, partial [Actinobacteria bacterium]|nr:AAA family ATPase [Actinomycetota bacterium]